MITPLPAPLSTYWPPNQVLELVITSVVMATTLGDTMLETSVRLRAEAALPVVSPEEASRCTVWYTTRLPPPATVAPR